MLPEENQGMALRYPAQLGVGFRPTGYKNVESWGALRNSGLLEIVGIRLRENPCIVDCNITIYPNATYIRSRLATVTMTKTLMT